VVNVTFPDYFQFKTFFGDLLVNSLRSVRLFDFRGRIVVKSQIRLTVPHDTMFDTRPRVTQTIKNDISDI
jgi:hypothetical protein